VEFCGKVADDGCVVKTIVKTKTESVTYTVGNPVFIKHERTKSYNDPHDFWVAIIMEMRAIEHQAVAGDGAQEEEFYALVRIFLLVWQYIADWLGCLDILAERTPF
jgi:hypothetical protein